VLLTLSAPAAETSPHPREPSDIELLRAFVSGDADKLAELDARHSGALLAFLTRYTRDRATQEDLAQEVWVTVLARAAEFLARAAEFDGGNLRAWLFSIARSRGVDAIRRRPRSGVVTGEGLDTHAAREDGTPDAEADETRQHALKHCIEEVLNPDELAAIRAKLADNSVEDILRLAGIDRSHPRFKQERQQVYNHVNTAKQKLRDCVEHKLGDHS
jgi:RNA polymerase sigma factor (sigma-70 family)